MNNLIQEINEILFSIRSDLKDAALTIECNDFKNACIKYMCFNSKDLITYNDLMKWICELNHNILTFYLKNKNLSKEENENIKMLISKIHLELIRTAMKSLEVLLSSND